MMAEATLITEQCGQAVRRVLEELDEKDRELLRRILIRTAIKLRSAKVLA